jgi:hypothetical protein
MFKGVGLYIIIHLIGCKCRYCCRQHILHSFGYECIMSQPYSITVYCALICYIFSLTLFFMTVCNKKKEYPCLYFFCCTSFMKNTSVWFSFLSKLLWAISARSNCQKFLLCHTRIWVIILSVNNYHWYIVFYRAKILTRSGSLSTL